MCDLDELIAKRLIEPAAPEAPARVAAELEMAKRHLESVVILRDVDPELAFAGAYDAARKAIAAHMRARAYRTTGGPGKHSKTMAYGRAVLAAQGLAGVLDHLETMRQLRHGSEYDVAQVTTGDVDEALRVAEAIVGAVLADLAQE